MITSLGFHTFTIYMNLTLREARLLYHAFDNYPGVYIIPPEEDNRSIADKQKWLRYNSTRYFNIKYDRDKYIGISWVLKFDKKSVGRYSVDEMKPCSIKATINPKVLAGVVDYVAAADDSYLNQVITNFNLEAAKISPLLQTFCMYALNRIDYCINFDLKELEIGCTPEWIMTLIKRAYIPANLKEWKKYDEKSHRMKPKESFYLKNNSINVNCYGKYAELSDDFPDCPNISDAKHVVRFEIQCKYPKVFSIGKMIKNNPGYSSIINEMLSDEISETVIRNYYNRIIGNGDYFTLELAKKQVRSQDFQNKKEYRLISTLELINQCRGISKAMDTLQGREQDDFRRSCGNWLALASTL